MSDHPIERVPLGPEREFPIGGLDEDLTDPVHTVAELLPDGFARYLRVFHPFLPADPSDPDRMLAGPARTWLSLAEETGAVFHPEIMWWSLIDALGGEQAEERPFWVSEGRLDEPTRSALFGLLAERGRTDTYFLYGLGAIVRGQPQLLFRAPVADYREVQAAADLLLEEVDETGPGPEWIWPIDRSWVVNTDYDLESTYIACDEDLGEAILSSAAIEALPVSRDVRVDNGADRINGRQ